MTSVHLVVPVQVFMYQRSSIGMDTPGVAMSFELVKVMLLVAETWNPSFFQQIALQKTFGLMQMALQRLTMGVYM